MDGKCLHKTLHMCMMMWLCTFCTGSKALFRLTQPKYSWLVNSYTGNWNYCLIKKGTCQFLAKHGTSTEWLLRGLSLHRKRVVGKTDYLDMTFSVDWIIELKTNQTTACQTRFWIMLVEFCSLPSFQLLLFQTTLISHLKLHKLHLSQTETSGPSCSKHR